MIKSLKESIAQHDAVCKEANYEEKYERAIRKCEKYKREVKDCERSMREMNENFYDREDSMDRDREDTLQELREQIEECEENHGDISRVISERDDAIRKYENLLRETEAKEKSRQAIQQAKTQQKARKNQAKAQQAKTNQAKSQQTRTSQPIVQLPKSRGQAIAKTVNNNQANRDQASLSRPVHTQQPQQYPSVAYPSQKPQQVLQQYPQQYAPQQQPLMPQQQLNMHQPVYTQQPLNTQLQGSKSQLRRLQPIPPPPTLQWQVYVAPDPKSKKRKISKDDTKSSPLSQQQAIPNQTNMNPQHFPQQQMNTRPPQQQMNTYSPQQQMNPYPSQQQMNPYPPYPLQINVPPPPQQINPHPPQQPQLAPFQQQQQPLGPYPHNNMNPNVQQPQWVSALPPSSDKTNSSNQPLTRADGTKPDEEDIIDLTQ
ncbi:hypothetical protein BD770DRAFT_169373 [Pilaira anomala]|nr:hypothetical protein BD770DRAFT_169373 [Pilaira anomala]